MALYHEASALLGKIDKVEAVNASEFLKRQIFGRKDLKSSPAQLYALVSETIKWSSVLRDVVESSGILVTERKLSPTLALVLVHDMLISKHGVALPQSHPLHTSIQRHRARLRAELTKVRIRRGYGTVEGLRAAVTGGGLENAEAEHHSGSRQFSQPATRTDGRPIGHPRWVRVNTLRSELRTQLHSTFSSFSPVPDLVTILAAPPDAMHYHIDPDVPNLLAFPPGTDMTKMSAYTSGNLVLQDKASCLPAVLLDWRGRESDGCVLDACAAPGNKTTLLAAMYAEQNVPNVSDTSAGVSRLGSSPIGRTKPVIAVERSPSRSETLAKMVRRANAHHLVQIRPPEDFLSLDPHEPELAGVRAILLDPSCSGSGMIGRNDGGDGAGSIGDVVLSVGTARKASVQSNRPVAAKRRKRSVSKHNRIGTAASEADAPFVTDDRQVSADRSASKERAQRLAALSSFQLHAVECAMRFPHARRIVYSTCSTHVEEDEAVVLRALQSQAAKRGRWEVLRRADQVPPMRRWSRRGDKEAAGRWLAHDGAHVGLGAEVADEVIEACIRCAMGTDEGTMGFFMAGFVRDDDQGPIDRPQGGEDSADEWHGFSDSDRSMDGRPTWV